VRTVLLIAFHFPPVRGSSGIQRTLRFAQHLPKYGWRPIVLTVDPRAYEATGDAPGNEIPEGLRVERAFGLDTARHLSLFGRYPRRLALPDRWASWKFWAVNRAKRLLQRERASVVWSTFPIATAHEIGLSVAKASGLPWIAEFRDPMWQGDYPPDPAVNRYWKQLESRVVERADRVVLTTPSAVEEYAARFAALPRERFVLLENGYDEETFSRIDPARLRGRRAPCDPLRLLHSGIIYPSERDPQHLFRAIAELKAAGKLVAQDLQLTLRASANEARYRPMLEQLRITDIVKLEPPIGYLPALEEMLTADGLLLLQASNCNAQIPAKLYEYLRADKPILALTDPAGDTARTLHRVGAGLVASLASVEAICDALPRFLESIRQGNWCRAPKAAVVAYDRKAQAGDLASLFETITASSRTARAPSSVLAE
jgi:glycosyltransferase involved in cell wall biosynthesis